MLNKVRTQIDPYFIRPDDEAMVRVQADVNEEEDDPIPWGEYGPYCPATLIQDGWLVPGKNEFEAYFQGKRHKFYGEKEQAYFKENISEFYHSNAIQIPAPRVMLLGVRGSGVKTQLERLHQRYKLPILDLKRNLLDLVWNEREKRKTERRLNKGFKPTELDENGNEIEDAELNVEGEDFDRPVHE